MERWADIDWIDGYSGVISISDIGRVRRRSYNYETMGRWRKLHKTTKPDKILSPYIERNGYSTIAVQINGKRKKFLVHRLVARAFVPGYEPHLTVNHINGIKTDNRHENLEWCTLATNTQKQWETGLVDLRADSNPQRKLHSGQVRIIRRLLRSGVSRGDLATLTGVSYSTITLIENGERWSSID